MFFSFTKSFFALLRWNILSTNFDMEIRFILMSDKFNVISQLLCYCVYLPVLCKGYNKPPLKKWISFCVYWAIFDWFWINLSICYDCVLFFPLVYFNMSLQAVFLDLTNFDFVFTHRTSNSKWKAHFLRNWMNFYILQIAWFFIYSNRNARDLILVNC